MHKLGLEQMATKIVKALIPSLNKYASVDQGNFEISSAYVSITRAARPSHRRYRTNPCDFVVDLNLGQEFTGGELIWLKPGGYSYRIEGK